MNRNIIISFSITIILIIFLGAISIVKMMELSDLTQKLYKHPFTVVNATKNIKINLVAMHKHMRDVVLSKNSEDMEATLKRVSVNEAMVYNEFTIIFDRYLGDKKDIQTSYDAFVQSKVIRDNVLSSMKNGKINEARKIMKMSGIKHIKYLNAQVDKMISYAQNKAIYFKNNALEKEMNSVITVIVILVIILIIVISILIILIRNISNNERKLKEHFHLIDQNIMTAKSDLNYKIIEASSALAHHLGLSKEELLLQKENFLVSDCSKELQSEIKRTIESGQEWRGEISKFDSDKNVKWLYSHVTPLLDEEYKIIGYTNILHDISFQKKIEEIARVDSLTNLYNRRFFDEKFPKMIKIANRQKRLLSFAMIDIDHFKEFNDNYGHQAGDIALKNVASSIKQTLKRPDDNAFRLGGEEFGALYMITNEEDALKIAERIRVGVEDLQITHAYNEASKYLSVSIGFFIIQTDNNLTLEEIYVKADKALYKAKQSGRNRVIVA